MHLLAFFDFLPKRLMFPQIISSTQLDMPCLQQSKRRKRATIVCFFEQNITRRMRRRFHEANTVGVPCKRTEHCCATLRRSQNNRNVGTCWAKSLTGFKLYATSANTVVVPCKRTQQITTLLGPTILGVVGQQCCVRLHGPLETVEEFVKTNNQDEITSFKANERKTEK